MSHIETLCEDKRILTNNKGVTFGTGSNALKLREEFGSEVIEFDEIYGPVCESLPGHANRMGVSVEENGCNFAIWAGDADILDVCLFDTEDSNKVLERWRLTRHSEDKNNIFCGRIPGMGIGDAYGLRVGGENYNKLLMDPYAKAFSGKFNAVDIDSDSLYSNNHDKDSAPYMPRCIVANESYDWGNDKRPNHPKNKRVIYEGHIKDQTYLLDEIPENLRGTYAGIASEPFIKYLKELGITTIELLPVQQFVSEPQLQEKGLTNHWGYSTLGFFAPHGEYSSSGQNGEQVAEFKDMIKRLHAADIEVIMDVEYNHTPEGSEEGPTLMFKGLDEKEMYHLSNGHHCNYSGCGNTLNASSDTGLKFILDSLHYWAEEMHVDGFRFDLASSLAREQPDAQVNMKSRLMNALKNDPILKELIIIVEPWDCSSVNSGEFGKIQQWNGRFRDVARDFWLNNGNSGEFAAALSASLVYGITVEETINFLTSHDGLTLHDLVSFIRSHNDKNGENGNDGTKDNKSNNFGVEGSTDNEEINNLRLQAELCMLLSLFIASGTPMLSHGDEIMKTQDGNNNSYCQDNETNWIDWNFSEKQKKLHKFVSNVIHFCMSHSTLTRFTPFTGQPVLGPGTESDVAWFRSDGHEFTNNDEAWKRKSVMGMYMSGIALKDISRPETVVDDDSFIFYVNSTQNDQEICLPKLRPYAGDYVTVINTTTGEVYLDGKGNPISDGKIPSKAMSAFLLKRTSSYL